MTDDGDQGYFVVLVCQCRWHQALAKASWWLATRGDWGSEIEAFLGRHLTRRGRGYYRGR